eukprot:Skav212672  [mRNA]  locus=scaffold1227:710858:717735:- [translate_table: standard]
MQASGHILPLHLEVPREPTRLIQAVVDRFAPIQTPAELRQPLRICFQGEEASPWRYFSYDTPVAEKKRITFKERLKRDFIKLGLLRTEKTCSQFSMTFQVSVFSSFCCSQFSLRSLPLVSSFCQAGGPGVTREFFQVAVD